ncbi:MULTISPECIES: Yip1 family protein [Pseudonocardia]|uniref:Uncharacterized protein n=2 Tax=Pseudonocardia TaxID=1847 RepID=A0A1Y2N9L7_PSEAH|nr:MULTISPECIES: Yip1 family protein [Pseudonocardia]OSY44165.1 hypothetical protein BG845_00286 [Pseudonocardia autotrophica]TDN74105.1 hypothetical protein C8E95_3220 [Pseudonocardia autotrophica]BBG04863.1 hypothetical protein Pdca_60720 [Pseudonocardia autotrophica]GEC23519.1 hypothetical protein PSA01_05480 [Pseudonocardia saturnea]
MSVDSAGFGEPRQRTVAELLAANGGSQSGRRRRRRASEDDEPGGAPAPGPGGGAPAAPPEQGPPRGPAGGDRMRPPAPLAEHPSFPSARRPDQAEGHGRPGAPGGRRGEPFVPNGNAPNGSHRGPANGAGPDGHPPQAFAPGNRPNGHPPEVHRGGPPPGYGGPNGAGRPDEAYGRPGRPDDGPPQQPGRPGRPADGAPQAYAARPGDGSDSYPDSYADSYGGYPDEIPTSRLGARRPATDTDDDGGPPTQFGAPPLDDGPPTGAYDPFVDDRDDAFDGGRTGVLAPERRDLWDDAPEEHDPQSSEHDDPGDEPDDGAPRGRRGRRRDPEEHDDLDGAQPPAGLDDAAAAGAAGTGQAWAVVIAQWIGGAVAGAAIWVLFRFLWFSFPIVALASAVVLTVGLVLGVRALLRNDDLKTTLFAVLVGLLLTVSPALLVLLDR